MAENNNALPKKKRKSSIKVDHADDGGENSNNEVEATHDEEIEAEKIRLKRLKKEAKKLRKLQSSSQLSSDPAEEHSKPTTDSNNDLETAPAWNEKHKSNKNKALKMSHKEIEDFRFAHGITVYPGEESHTYAPFTKFSKLYQYLDACPYVVDYLERKNFAQPSPIQAQCWLPLLQGRDLIGIAQTGSGKTLAFLIPALLKLAQLGVKPKTAVPSPRVLIVAPTRELAAQSHEVAVDVGGPLSVCIYGGMPKHVQKAELKQGADIVVATPGRLIDLVDENAISLNNVRYLVLDEADRMLDEGFEPAIRRIVSHCLSNSDHNNNV